MNNHQFPHRTYLELVVIRTVFVNPLAQEVISSVRSKEGVIGGAVNSALLVKSAIDENPVEPTGMMASILESRHSVPIESTEVVSGRFTL